MLKAGASKIKITPRAGVFLEGFLRRKELSVGIHDDLWAKVLVLDDEKEKAVLITTDLIALDREFVIQTRKKIEQNSGINENNILISSSHTHSGPCTASVFPHSKINKNYLEGLNKKLIKIVIQASKNLKPAKIGWGEGKTRIGANRIGPAGPMDDSVGVMKVIDNLSGDSIAVFVNYTCHPTVLGHDNLLISGDFPGYAMNQIEKEKKTIALFTNGAAADISTRYTRKENSFKEAKRLGNMLAEEVLRVIKRINVRPEARLSVVRKEIKLPLRELPSLKDAKKMRERARNKLNQLKRKGGSYGVLRTAEVNLEGAEILINLIKSLKRGEIMTEVQVVKINDGALVCIPGELSVETGLEIKRKAKSEHTYIIGYANNYIGYIPNKKAYQRGGYEVITAKVGPKAEEKLKKTILKLI